jgi:DNA repair protein SbcD/Mre11
VPEVRILHTADIHLDSPGSALGLDAVRARARRDELRQTLARIVELARQRQVQLLLIAGDLWEDRYVTRETVASAAELFASLTPARVLIQPGKADPVTDTSYYTVYPWPANVHIFRGNWERLDLEEWGVTVWGAGEWPQPETDAKEGRGRRGEENDRLQIALLHGKAQAADLAKLGFDYVALGGQHQPTVVLHQGTRPVAQYAGSPEPHDWSETGARGVLVGTIGKRTLKFQLETVSQRQAVVRHLDLTGAGSVDDVIEALLEVDSPLERRKNLWRITLGGLISPSLALDLPLLADRLAGEFFFLKLADQTIPDYEFERISLEKTARGHFVRHLLAMQKKASGAVEERIRRALTLGMRAFERGAGR